jgi:tRNA (mo5U34)-methyltransferase
METETFRQRVEAVNWYHEFDFGNGLRTQPGDASHCLIWRFIADHLTSIDFTGKTVLDIGCWDGYWSFRAEKQGAAYVLATDDVSQNPSCGEGLQLARQLLHSSIEINQNLSIYNLSSLNRTFDIILCLGVYDHLHTPLYALAQVRHCCHANTLVVREVPIPGVSRLRFGLLARPRMSSGQAGVAAFFLAWGQNATAVKIGTGSNFARPAVPQPI